MEDLTEAVILVAVTELLAVKIQPWHLSGHREGLLTEEVEATKKTNKDRTARHKKFRAMDLIPC